MLGNIYKERRYKLYLTIFYSIIFCLNVNPVWSQVAKSSGTIQGKLTFNEEIPSYVTIYLQNSSFSRQMATDNGGNFQFEKVPFGNYIIKISSLNYRMKEQHVILQSDTSLSFSVDATQQKLNEVYVTASESTGLTSSSIIDRKAMQLLQPSSFTDLLELLPGGRSINPALSRMNQIRLRETGDDSDYSMGALGTAFYMDGSPINTTANMQSTKGFTITDPHGSRNSTNKGVDMRFLSTDQIERVEIIRGIPSVEYGDLTTGLVKIERKKGYSPFNVRIKSDGFSKLGSIGKGFEFKNNLLLNIDLDFLDSKADPTNNFENFKRFTGSLRTQKSWNKNYGQLIWNASFDYSTNIDNDRSDPDNSYELTDRYHSSYHRYALSNQLRVDFDHHKGILRRLELNSNFSFEQDKIELNKWIQASTATVLVTATEQGEFDASYITPSYLGDLTVDGKPINAFLKATATLGFKTGAIQHDAIIGTESNYSKNAGRGQVYDLNYPVGFSSSSSIAQVGATARPRAFNSIPAMNNLSFYVQDQLSFSFGRQKFKLAAGLRGTTLLNLDQEYTLAGKLNLDPRVNVRWQLPATTIASKPFTLSFGVGFGMLSKMPTLDQLYPAPNYIDIIQLNYYHNNPAFRKANAVTYIVNPTNYSLNVAQNKKWEFNSDLIVDGNRLSITFYHEYMSSAFRSSAGYLPLTYKTYDNSSVDAEGLTEAPQLSDFSYAVNRQYFGYTTTTNGSSMLKKGFEYQFTSKRFTSINTRFTVNGAWFYTKYTNSQPTSQIISETVVTNGGKVRQYLGIYDEDSGYIRNQFNTNFTVDSYLPDLGLNLYMTVQSLWFKSDQQNRTPSTPSHYIDIEGNMHPYTEQEQNNPDLMWFDRKYSESRFLKYEVPIDLQLNIKASKSFAQNRARVSMFVNRLLHYTPDYTNANDMLIGRRGSSPYFGMELNLTF